MNDYRIIFKKRDIYADLGLFIHAHPTSLEGKKTTEMVKQEHTRTKIWRDA